MTDTDVDNLLSDAAVNAPFAFYAALRERAPVHYNAQWDGWIITPYEDVSEAFRNFEDFSVNRVQGPWGRADDEEKSSREILMRVLSKWMVFNDPPEHKRLRGLVGRAFTPKRIEQLRPQVRDLVTTLIDDLPTGEPVDFLGDFAFHLPAIVISDYLGLPAGDRDLVKKWSNDLAGVIFVRGEDTDRSARAERAVVEMIDYLRRIIRERRRSPEDDLLSAMVADDDGGDEGAEFELISNLILLVFAGHETTMNTLANAVVAFEEHPGQWAKLRTEPGLERVATEEILRYEGPIRAQARWARRTVEVRGKRIEEGSRVLLAVMAANHDPSVFADPDRLVIDRNPNPHLAFGAGAHTCMGAPLARLELQETFRQLADRFERIEVTDERVSYNRTIVSRSLTGLHTRFHPAG